MSKEIAPMEKETAVTFGFDFLGGKDVMPVSGFYGPYPMPQSSMGRLSVNTVTEQVFADLAEAGVNHLSGFGWNMEREKELADLAFRCGEKYGIGITLNTSDADFSSVEAADKYFKAYKEKYKSFVSYFVTDEPCGLDYLTGREIAVFVPFFDVLNEIGVFPYCNLLPIDGMEKREAYERYIDRYIELCKPWVLSYDHYIGSQTADFVPYFYNMSIIREKAEKAGLPWWGFIGCGEDWFTCKTYDRPTESEFIWNINTTLAYGAKGLQYYLAVQNHEDLAKSLEGLEVINEETIKAAATRIGIIGTHGERTRYWQYAKNINAHIRAIEKVLMNSVNKGVIASSEKVKASFTLSKHLIDGDSWRELKGIDGDAIVGCMNYDGKSAFYVVNYSRERGQRITLGFHGTQDLTLVRNAKQSKADVDTLVLDMNAGEGVLILIN